MHPSRREFIRQAVVAGSGLVLTNEAAASDTADHFKESIMSEPTPAHSLRDSFVNILRPPDVVVAYTEQGRYALHSAPSGVWSGADISVRFTIENGAMHVALSAPKSEMKRVHLRWKGNLEHAVLFLGDHWERGYGDLGWRPGIPERVMPWYFLAYDGSLTHSYGVKTGAAALCFWQADTDGISLWADVYSGGAGVQLGERTLEVCTVIGQQGKAGHSPFQTLRAFCKQMCPHPRLTSHPVYGANDWYYAYGNNTAARLLDDTKRLVALSPTGANRPFSVIDAGWQPPGGCDGGPWDRGNARFPSLPGLAADIRTAGARPGIWIRPLAGQADTPETWKLGRDKSLLDPTVPEVMEKVAADIARLKTWGYDLIKHDFSTFDILGLWGFEMNAEPARGGWHFAHRSQTNAEIMRELYQTIRKAAGDVTLIGCNTVSHLSAGVFEICRIGDDTSGRIWERTRKMGVNSLAFRIAHEGTFYGADGDCLGLTPAVSWEHNRQWLDLLARSGTPLFVSAQAEAIGPEQERALKAAFALAAEPQPVGEPLDWMQTGTPRRWKLHGQETHYDWFDSEGASPFSV